MPFIASKQSVCPAQIQFIQRPVSVKPTHLCSLQSEKP